jgi:hypothetical protein
MTHDEKGHLYIGRNALPASTKSKNAVVMKSTNDGESWSYLTNGWDNTDITNNRVSGIVLGKDGEIWATTDKTSGPFHSTNYGASWTLVRDGLETADGSSNGIVVTKDNHVFIALKGAFVHRHLNPTSVEEDHLGSLALSVFPNPAHGSTTVDVIAEHNTEIFVELYSVSGVSVLEGTSLHLDKGQQGRIALKTESLAAGSYTLVVRNSTGVVKSFPVVVAH